MYGFEPPITGLKCKCEALAFPMIPRKTVMTGFLGIQAAMASDMLPCSEHLSKTPQRTCILLGKRHYGGLKAFEDEDESLG